MPHDLKRNLSSRRTWRRLLFMLLFTVLYGVAELVLTFLVLFQAGAALITGHPNRRLRELGHELASYVYTILLYLTFRSDERPYPFGPWPEKGPIPGRDETLEPEALVDGSEDDGG